MDPETHREGILLSLCIQSYLKPTPFQELTVWGVQLYDHLEFQFLLKLAWLEFLLLATQSSDWDSFHYPEASLVTAYSAFSHVHFLQMAISQNVCEALMTRRLIAELFIRVKTSEKKLRWSTARDLQPPRVPRFHKFVDKKWHLVMWMPWIWYPRSGLAPPGVPHGYDQGVPMILF